MISKRIMLINNLVILIKQIQLILLLYKARVGLLIWQNNIQSLSIIQDIIKLHIRWRLVEFQAGNQLTHKFKRNFQEILQNLVRTLSTNLTKFQAPVRIKEIIWQNSILNLSTIQVTTKLPTQSRLVKIKTGFQVLLRNHRNILEILLHQVKTLSIILTMHRLQKAVRLENKFQKHSMILVIAMPKVTELLDQQNGDRFLYHDIG